MIKHSALLSFALGLALFPCNASAKGTLIDDSRAVIQLPSEMSTEATYPVLLSLRSDGDARAAVEAWSQAAEKRRWIVVGSKECRNDVTFTELLPKLEALLKDVQKRYPVDSTRIIVAGYAGGAMAAHALVFSHPEWSSGLVINTGIMHPSFARQIAAYPKGKWAVFLASPTDFRYEDMKRDRAFLEKFQWQTEWIEFEGGHAVAPQAAHEMAARWLDERLPRPIIRENQGAVLTPASAPAQGNAEKKTAEATESKGQKQDERKGTLKPPEKNVNADNSGVLKNQDGSE